MSKVVIIYFISDFVKMKIFPGALLGVEVLLIMVKAFHNTFAIE